MNRLIEHAQIVGDRLYQRPFFMLVVLYMLSLGAGNLTGLSPDPPDLASVPDLAKWIGGYYLAGSISVLIGLTCRNPGKQIMWEKAGLWLIAGGALVAMTVYHVNDFGMMKFVQNGLLLLTIAARLAYLTKTEAVTTHSTKLVLRG